MLNRLISGHLILCPSARLVRSIKNDIARQHINAGQTQWQSPHIMTWAQWLDSIIEQSLLVGNLTAPPSLLSPLNEQLLWQQVIKQSLQKVAFDALFDVAGLASAAIEANQYVIAWRLQVPRDQMAEEARQFALWQRTFQQRCQQLNVLESVRYIDWQLDILNQDALQTTIGGLPGRIEFAGFDQAAPQEQRLREILIQKKITVADYVSTRPQPALTQHIAVEHQDAECRAAVGWAMQQITANPHVKLAIVTPRLSEVRNQLADLLDDVFYPASVRHSQSSMSRNYNFSLGTPLNQQPMIQAALNLLRLFSNYELAQAEVSAVLLSPFWSASMQESDARAQLDAKMREQLPMQFKLTQFLDFASYHLAKGLNIAHLITHIKTIEALSNNKRSTASQWAQTLAEILSALNWPGERVLNSLEYQASIAWQTALSKLKQLDVLGNVLYQAEAVQILQQICTDQVFQAETTSEVSIQILGIMEALSAPVDAMWCMHMNDHIWPPPSRPNPLLPAFIQRAAKLPNADNSVQAAFAENIQQRLLHSAKHIIFSSSQTEGSSQLRASPLMKDIPTLNDAHLAETLAETLSQSGSKSLNTSDLQWIDDHTAPKVESGERISGGTSLFRAQAICPAWAFYQFRLGAKALKVPSNGLDMMTRGILVHTVLTAFWQQRHFSDLRCMSDDNLAQALNAAIKAALDDLSKQHKVLSENLLALEHERLFKLVGDWLRFEIDYWEKTREVPFNIVACEAEKIVLISGIEVRVKIDRIHQFENGSIEFVDYKTGQKPDMASWGEMRIIEPQLPIYAAFYDDGNIVNGVQFGMVKTAEHAYIGIADANFEAELEKRKPKLIQRFSSWQHLLQHWRASIEGIADEIKAGEAAVKFDDEKNLAYCEVLPLLRLPERHLQFERFEGEQV
jgi:probable DNA repair protein